MQQEQAVSEGVVFETFDVVFGWHSFVGPGDQMLLVYFSHSLLPVHLAELPDAGQGQGDISVNNVDACHADQHQSQLIADFNHVVAVLDDEDAVGFV